MVKINNISITGLRGVRHNLNIALNGKSALLYGDNGSGKSTLSDVFEWFLYDKVEHLTSEEIGRKGKEALRNVFLEDNEAGSFSLEFTHGEYNDVKSIEIINNNLKVSHSNDSNEFTDYIAASQEERVILRYRDLVAFVLSKKTEKLRALSEIIGYSQVTNIRDTLRTVLNRVSNEIKTNNIDNQVSHQQSQIIEQFQQNVTSDKQFLEIVNELVKPFSLDMIIDELKDINEVLKKIKTPDDSEAIKQEVFLSEIKEKLSNLPVYLDELENKYQDYKSHFDSIVSDIEKLNKLTLEKLLATGQELLSGKDYTDNACPLCLEEQSKEILLSDIKSRIIELDEIKGEQNKLIESKTFLKQQIIKTLGVLQPLLNDKQANEDNNEKYKKNIETLLKAVNIYQEQLKFPVSAGNRLEDNCSLLVKRDLIDTVKDNCEEQLNKIRETRKKDSKSEVYGKIMIADHAYYQIKRLKDEKAAYERQRNTLEVIYAQFIKKQKESIEAFLDNFSAKIDEIYQFLNPGEKVENIKLVPITKNDELSGITIQFDFLESKEVTPPHRFLSESHLNCLGIAFFLSSVEAFNKKNKFIVLDDVISSFDADHRKRFSDLLIEKYTDYQIILLTHEKTWFNIVNNLVRSKNWEIHTLRHNEIKGTYIDEAPKTLRKRIEQKILDREESNLGNDARKHLEHLLKHIAQNVEVKVPFKFNNANEDRMAFELLTDLKSTIKKRKCSELKKEPVIDRLLGSLFIGNKDSHDSKTEPTFSDMKAFWQDVVDFEKLFYCQNNDCRSPLALKNYDKVNKNIRCNRGELSYSWYL